MEENCGIQCFWILLVVQVLSELLVPSGPKNCALNFLESSEATWSILYPPGISPPVHCINFGQVSPERSPSAHLDSPHWVDIGCDLKQENVTHWVFPFTVHKVTSHTPFHCSPKSHILNIEWFFFKLPIQKLCHFKQHVFITWRKQPIAFINTPRNCFV